MKKILINLCAIIISGQLVAQYNVPSTNIYYNSGNVGVGTSTPGYNLDVVGMSHANIFIADAQSTVVGGLSGWFRGPATGSANVIIQGNAGTAGAFWLTANSELRIGGTGNTEPAVGALNITTTGSVGVGTATPGSNKLAVEGTLGARKVIVTATNPFPDYVFRPGYPLIPLDSVAGYIHANNRLPEMPSADSVAKHGLDLGGNQVLLLKKIEELTLYAIEQKAQIDRLLQQNTELLQLKKECEAGASTEQDKKISDQERRLEKQQQEIEALKALVKKLTEK